MKLNVYSIRDIKAEIYGNPFYMSQDGQALRAFGDLVGDEKTSISKHPEDYQLFKLAEYDDVSGKHIALDAPKYMSQGSDWTKQN